MSYERAGADRRCHRQSWIEANFKETELTYLRAGQSVSVAIDTYPGKSSRARSKVSAGHGRGVLAVAGAERPPAIG